ncbi:glycosyltransferase family 4 protein [Patescibacteria group bacterium]|nr:glycosyltransferase family 4 protein [Patescibacteria group bacterium]
MRNDLINPKPKEVDIMKKILQYHTGYYKSSGGVETYITGLVKNLDYNFEILADALPGYPLIDYPRKNVKIIRFKPDNYNIASFNYRFINRVLFPYRLYADIIRIKNKRKYLKRAKYDLVHFHDSGVGGALTKLSYMLKSAKLFENLADFSYVEPKILTIHGLSCLMTDNPMVKEQEMNFIKQFENIICVDERLYTFLKGNLEDDVRLWHVPNSVDTRRFEFIPLPLDNKIKIGFIGRLEKSRGISLLYELINNLPPYVEVYVLGAGNSMDIEKFKSHMDMTKIHFEANLNYKEAHKFYRKFDILLNPVIAEGISRVTLEAMSSGRPVIMLDKGNRYPVIDKKTGYLIKNDIGGLLKLLRYLDENRNELKEVIENARKVVEKEYDNNVLIPRIGEIYEEITG